MMKGVKPVCLTSPKKHHPEKIVFDSLLFILKSNVLCCFFIAPLKFSGQLLIGSSKCFLSGGRVESTFRWGSGSRGGTGSRSLCRLMEVRRRGDVSIDM